MSADLVVSKYVYIEKMFHYLVLQYPASHAVLRGMGHGIHKTPPTLRGTEP